MKMVSRVRPAATVGAAIVALALAMAALPAMASAAPSLKSGGKNLAVGATLVETSTDLKIETEAGTYECSRFTFEGKVTENPGARVEGEGGSAEGCHTGEAPYPFSEVYAPFTQFDAAGTDEGELVFTYNIFLSETHSVECHWEGKTVTTRWTNGSSIDVIWPSTLVGAGPAPCPSRGTISGELALETSAGRPVTVNE